MRCRLSRYLDPMKVWELIARLEGVDPESDVVVRDGEAHLVVEVVVLVVDTSSTPRVILVVGA